MMMDIPILVGVMLAVLLLGFVIGALVQKVIDDAALSRERERGLRLRAEVERFRRDTVRVYAEPAAGA